MSRNHRSPVRTLGFLLPMTALAVMGLWALLQPSRTIAQQTETRTPTTWVVTATPTPDSIFAAATRSAQQTRQAQTTGTPTATSENMVLATDTPTARVVTNTPEPANGATATAQVLLATAVAFTTGTPDPNIPIVTATPTVGVTVITPTPEELDVLAAATRSIQLTLQATREGTPTPLPRHVEVATRTPTPRVRPATPTAANAATATMHALQETAIAFTTGTPNVVAATPTSTRTPPPTRTPLPTPTASPTAYIVTPTPRPANVLEAATRKAEEEARAQRGETPVPLPENAVVATVTHTPRVATNTPTPANDATATAHAIHATAIFYTTGVPNIVTATPTRTPNARQATRTAEAIVPVETSASTPTPITPPVPTSTPELEATPTPTASLMLTPTPAPEDTAALVPEVTNFIACLTPCSGRNSREVFREGTNRVYMRYRYEQIPVGANYTRTWRQDNEIWIQYDCSWPGPESGDFEFRLSEPGGLRSGLWEITVEVNGNVLLRDGFEIEGDWSYWDPIGTVTGMCQGLIRDR